MNSNLRSPRADSFSRSCFFLQDLRRRSMVPTPTVPNEIVIEAMIKGLRPGPTAQYFARKPPQTLEKLLQKMDEYIRADNDFCQRREEAYRFSEMTRGFGGRIHPRHVRSIHSTQSDDRGSQQQRPQYSLQASGQQQSSFRPPAPRGRGARGYIIKRVATFTLSPFLAILNIRSVLVRQLKNARTPYIKSGRFKT